MSWFRHGTNESAAAATVNAATQVITVTAGNSVDVKMSGDPRGGTVTAAPGSGGTALVQTYTGNPDAAVDTDMLENWPSNTVAVVKSHGIDTLCTLIRLTATTANAKFTILLANRR